MSSVLAIYRFILGCMSFAFTGLLLYFMNASITQVLVFAYIVLWITHVVHIQTTYDDTVDYTKKSIKQRIAVSIVLLASMLCTTYAMYRASIPTKPEHSFDPGNTVILLVFTLISVVTEFCLVSDYIKSEDKRKSQ